MSFLKKLKEIRSAQNFNDFYSHYISRHFSFIITAILSYTKITPNAVTVSMLLFGLIGGGFLSVGSPICFIIGGLCFVMLNILDAVDGEFARYTNQKSEGGDYIDRVIHYLTNPMAIMGLGVGLYFTYEINYILIITIIIEIAYNYDEIARDLILAHNLKKNNNKGSAKSNKETTVLVKPGKLKRFMQMTISNIAFFHNITIFGLLDFYEVLSFKHYVLIYFLVFGCVTLIKALLRTRIIYTQYFKGTFYRG